METPLNGSSHPDHEYRPPLPPRPTAEYLLSPSATLISPTTDEPLIRRKPVIPRRSSRLSLEKRSYAPIEMAEIGSIEPSEKGIDVLATQPLPPKAFHKTHQFFRWNLGYWRMPARHFSIFSILFLFTFLPCWYSQYGFSIVRDSSISPFTFDCLASTGWSFVGIDLRFGRFSFGEAKAIDLAWNWVVGRGLQGILTLLAYRVFSDALLRATELSTLPYELYVTVALPSTKIELLWQVLVGLFKYGNWRVKAIFVWLILSTIYLIAVPGLMDAATAYESSLKTNFQWPNGTGIAAEKLQNWDENKAIVDEVQVCLHYYLRAEYGLSAQHMYNVSYVEFNATYKDPDDSGYSPYDNCTSSDNEPPDGSRAYSGIYSIYKWQDKAINDEWWNHYKDHPYECLQTGYWSDWKFYPTNQDHFQCITEIGVYQWGFSFEWLFLITIINSIWLWGLWILWVDCDTNSEFCRKRRRLGIWRAIADISEAMREELGPNICAYSDEELLEALRKRPPVKYHATRGTEEEPGHIGLSSRNSGRKFAIQWNREYGKTQ